MIRLYDIYAVWACVFTWVVIVLWNAQSWIIRSASFCHVLRDYGGMPTICWIASVFFKNMSKMLSTLPSSQRAAEFYFNVSAVLKIRAFSNDLYKSHLLIIKILHYSKNLTPVWWTSKIWPEWSTIQIKSVTCWTLTDPHATGVRNMKYTVSK